MTTNEEHSTTNEELVVRLQDQEDRLVLPRFGLDDAHRLGRLVADHALAANLPVLVDVRRGDFVLFRASLPGVTIDQQVWAERKAAVVQRMENSSALVEARLAGAGVDPVAMGWLDHRYALTGGSFPVRVTGAGMVAAVTASGLSSQRDHELVVEGLERLLEEQLRTQ